MKYSFIIIMLIALLLFGCKTQNLPSARSIQGSVINLHTRSGLNHAFIYNNNKSTVDITDSIGKFSITANVGDSIRFHYVGMKDSVIVLKSNSPDYLNVELDTINTTLIDKGVYRIY
ncbi:MAG: hypothetical protein HDS51_00055 [Barnesiella sp.]|nr:hypothetical protein [Barnesiella sp.]